MIEPNPQFFAKGREDEGIRVVFFEEAVENRFKSKLEGKQVWETQVFIKKFVPGNVDNPGARKATEVEIQKWHAEYETFEKKRTMVSNGYPLEQWARLGKADVYTLKAANIFTLEELAELSEGQVSGLSVTGARTLQKEAREALEASTKIKETSDLLRREEELKQERDDLKSEIEKLRNQVTEIALRKKPGRPKKKPKEEEKINGVILPEEMIDPEELIVTDGTQ